MQLHRLSLARARPLEQELEGLGPARLYFVDLEELDESLPAPPDATLPKRLGTTFRIMGRGMPYLLGLKRAD